MKYILLLTLSISFSACAQQADNKSAKSVSTSAIRNIQKSESEWKKELSEFEYYVLREKGTERAFSGKLLNVKEEGVFVCKACELPLFSSETKFKSGTGWPSFWDKIGDDNVAEEVDKTFGMVRTEVLCGRCGGHLGHVFPDGPKPTGLRYCINSVSLKFKPKAQN